MSEEKSSISCHILDTSVGKPARGVRVRLEGPTLSPSAAAAAVSASASSPTTSTTGATPQRQPPRQFESQTDEDGRIKGAWLPFSSERASGDVPTYTLEDVLADEKACDDVSVWTLRFDTEAYFGGPDKTFFPEVVVQFSVRRGQHYHVPLLLAPYSYSTYRGS